MEVKYRAKKPDNTYTEVLEVYAIHATLDGIGVNEDIVLENWIYNFYDIEIWDSEMETWR